MYFMNFQFIGPDSAPTRPPQASPGSARTGRMKRLFGTTRPTSTVIYRAQGSESEEWATPQHLVDLSGENVPALDADELASCADERRYEDAVAEDYEIGDQAGVDGTRSLFVKGQKLESWDYATVQAAVVAAQP